MANAMVNPVNAKMESLATNISFLAATTHSMVHDALKKS